MQKFIITDIVKMKNDDKVLYMVVDVQDFTKTVKEGQKPIIDIDYELIQVYPVKRRSTYMVLGQEDLDLHVKKGGKGFDVLMQLITKERERVGLFGTPDFLEIAEKNLLAERNQAIMKDNPTGMPKKDASIVRYDLLEDIDKCLDAINHLNELHSAFGDDTYLQLKELVIDRIKILQKSNNVKKKK